MRRPFVGIVIFVASAGMAGSIGPAVAGVGGNGEKSPPISGRWSGATEVSGITLPLAVEFAATGDGCTATLDIQGQVGLPLENVGCAADGVRFELAAPIGRARWQGRLVDGALVGTFEQNAATGTFRMEPDGAVDGAADGSPEPAPYEVREVAFDAGEVRLAGTLTVPEGDGPHPAVILVTGSGPQDRDEQLFGFRPFRVLADALTRAGIAALRYDERGVGASSGDYAAATLHDFAADARAAVDWLRGQPGIDPRRVGILGHSEGGTVGPYVAARTDAVAFLVLLAPPTVDGETLIREQTKEILKAAGLPAAMMEPQLERQRRLFDAVRSGEGWEALERESLAEARRQLSVLPEDQREQRMAAVEAQVRAELAAARSPAYKALLEHDPGPDLRKVRVPTLAVFGELDTQVPDHVCVGPLEAAFAGEDAGPLTVEVVPGANHLFQEAVTGSPSEYAALPKRFIDGFVDLVVDWTVATTEEDGDGESPGR